MADTNGTRTPVELGSEHFSPYRADGKLYGFVCVVTGAHTPVGRAIVAELAAHGAAAVYACSSTPSDLLNSVTAEFPKTKVINYPAGIINEEDTLSLIDDVLNQWGRLDIWVCNASTSSTIGITNTTAPDILDAFNASATPALFALKRAPAAMQKTTPRGNYPNAAPKEHEYGSIITVISATNTSPTSVVASNAALGVVKAGVPVLKGSGVRINAISVGHVEGDEGIDKETAKTKIALERAARPQEVGRVAGFLASGFSSYITGATLTVDGGVSAMSGI